MTPDSADDPDGPDPAAGDELVLETVEGGEDFLVTAVQTLGAMVLQVGRGWVRCRVPIDRRQPLRAVRLFGDAGLALGAPTDPDFLVPLQRGVESGIVAAGSPAPVRFRVGAPDPERRGDVVHRVEQTLGWVNDPSDYTVNLTALDEHRWTAQLAGWHWTRRFGSLERRGWSTTPLVAEVMVRLLKPEPDQTVLDPTCGTGTLLLAVAAHAPGCRLLGTDLDPDTLALAQRNLDRAGVSGELAARSAVPFAVADRGLDRVVANLPFGKQVGSHTDNQVLYPAVLREVARTLTGSGRAVLLTEDKHLLTDTVARTKGIKIIRDRVLRYGGATPSAYVISRTRR